MSPQSGSHAKALAWQAAQAATSGGTAQGAFAMKELAKLAKDFHDSQLQLAMAEMTLQGLQACEMNARKCVKSLVQAISPNQPHLAQDAAWALMQLLQKCASATAWALDAGGLQAVQGCLRCWKGEGGDSFAWLAFSMGGLQSIVSLLQDLGEASGSSGVADLVWIIYSQSSWKDQHGEEKPYCRELVQLLVQHLNFAWQRQRFKKNGGWRDEEVQVVHATVAVLQQMSTDLPSVASRLVEEKCGPLFAEILQVLMPATYGQNAKTSAKCCQLLAAMASSRCNGAILLREGVQTVLLTAAQQEGVVGEAACSALPWLLEHQKLREMLHALAVAEIQLTSAKRLKSFVDTLWHLFDGSDSEDPLLRFMPSLMDLLLQLRAELQQARRLKGVQDSCFQALCGATKALVPLAQPGKLKELDAFISILVQELQVVDLPGGGTPSFEMLVNELGKVSHSPEWCHHLRELEVDKLVVLRMNQARGNKRAMKYSIWLTSSLRGLPFLAQELQQNVSSDTTVDACFCTIVDILDEDVEGEWFLRHQHREAQQQLQATDLSQLLGLILQGMLQHQDESYIQARGCHCLALVLTAREQLGCGRLLHLGKELLVQLLDVSVAVLRMSTVNSTVRDSSFLLRTMLEPSTCPEGCERQNEERMRQLLAQELCSRGVPDVLLSHLNSYAYMKDERHSELLEGVLACLVHLGGVWAALGPLAQLEPSGEAPTLAKACGLKVLFEMGKEEPVLLEQAQAPATGETGPEVVLAMISDFVDRADDSNLRRHAELLAGLCQLLIERKARKIC